MKKDNSERCPLCKARKPKRFCPAKGADICSVCCGTKREVEIDCPSDCIYLWSGREYESRRTLPPGQEAQRTERLWQDEFILSHTGTFVKMWGSIISVRRQFPEIVDSDLQSAVESLIQTYQTLDKGIYYETLPAKSLQKEFYLALKSVFESAERESELSRLKTGTILDCLNFHKEMGQAMVFSRPKSRAFLDRIEEMYRSSASNPVEEPRIVTP